MDQGKQMLAHIDPLAFNTEKSIVSKFRYSMKYDGMKLGSVMYANSLTTSLVARKLKLP